MDKSLKLAARRTKSKWTLNDVEIFEASSADDQRVGLHQ
jgi:hypothetical protein